MACAASGQGSSDACAFLAEETVGPTGEDSNMGSLSLVRPLRGAGQPFEDVRQARSATGTRTDEGLRQPLEAGTRGASSRGTYQSGAGRVTNPLRRSKVSESLVHPSRRGGHQFETTVDGHVPIWPIWTWASRRWISTGPSYRIAAWSRYRRRVDRARPAVRRPQRAA